MIRVSGKTVSHGRNIVVTKVDSHSNSVNQSATGESAKVRRSREGLD
jgi:hypothetical protein